MATATKQIETRIDIPEKAREQVCATLNEQLADMFDLFSQTKQAHWNVKGSDFYQLHKLFDKLAEELAENIDVVAERVTALGGVAMGTVHMSAARSRLPEFPDRSVQSMAAVEVLAVRYASLAETTRAAIDTASERQDETTANILQDISAELDKDLWMLEAHLQK
ncbi:MAG TPA: DNA starvation/stationary phase protection protein Dps [Anaerolineales bacterium]|nr:DNA starvation/stationary phase protection protein Dps [Anaerolineales bacterium]